MPVGVLCAVRGPGETAVVTALDGASGRLTVQRRCADLAELLAAAAAGLGQLAVVSADLPHLDREAVAQLHAARVRVLALVGLPPGQAERMGALGVDAVLADDAEARLLVAAVLSLAAQRDPDLGEPHPGWVARLDGAPVPVDQAGADPGSTAGRARGRVVAVWGPTGAPGRSTVAVNLAAELAALQPEAAAASPADPRGALIIDADTYGGTVAQLLGMLDESPGLAAAARAAGQGNLGLATLAALTPVVAPGLRVLTGISRANRWPELPASALEVVWELARGLAAWTVVDCGFSLEQDEALSYDTRAPRRNAATLSALQAADIVVVVGSGDPVGVQRLVRALIDLANLTVPVTGRRLVVVNRLRASAAGRRPAEALTETLRRYAGVDAPHFVPDDRAGVDAALLAGATLREAAAGSPARRAIAALAAQLVRPGPAPDRTGTARAVRRGRGR